MKRVPCRSAPYRGRSRREGGHVVIPSAYQPGHTLALLRRALPGAADHGIPVRSDPGPSPPLIVRRPAAGLKVVRPRFAPGAPP